MGLPSRLNRELPSLIHCVESKRLAFCPTSPHMNVKLASEFLELSQSIIMMLTFLSSNSYSIGKVDSYDKLFWGHRPAGDEAASRWVDRGYGQGYNDHDRVTNVDSIGCTGMHVTGFFLAVAPF